MDKTHESNTHTKTSIFLMEIIIAILIFIICGAVCVKMFTTSYVLNSETNEYNHAVVLVTNAAELFRYNDGDMSKYIDYYSNINMENESAFKVFYDSNFEECNEDNARYYLSLKLSQKYIDDVSMKELGITFNRKDSKEIFAINVEK